jgi:adenosine deaminase
LEQLAFDFCQRQWEQHVIYTEVRYSPHLLAEEFEIGSDGKAMSSKEKRVSAEMVLGAVTAGLRRGSKKFDITVNQILCAITWRPEWAMPTLELAKKHERDFPCATVGVDIAAGEEHFDKENFPNLYQPHYEMMQAAKAANFPTTLHAGEATDLASKNVRTAIADYGATRVGHGYRMVDSAALMKFVSDNNCHIEVCPTSSDETGGWVYKTKDWKNHPCITMQEHGVSFSLSSDDPAVFHTSLSWQYRTGLAKMGLTTEEIVQCNLAAIDAAFCPDRDKEKFRKRVIEYSQRSPPKTYRRSVSETFADRVYLETQLYV